MYLSRYRQQKQKKSPLAAKLRRIKRNGNKKMGKSDLETQMSSGEIEVTYSR